MKQTSINMKIVFAGDFSTQNRLEGLDRIDIKQPNGESFYFKDYTVVNYESPLATDGQPIKKIGPNLYNSVLSVRALKGIGVDLVTLANNHFRDYGEEGCLETIKECKRNGIAYVGGGKQEEAGRSYLIINDGLKIGIINVCENEFSSCSNKRAGSHGFDIIDVYDDIQSIRGQVDYVVVIHHGGVEHHQLPTPRMKKVFRHLIDVGADIIINHHQHCYSGWECYKNGLIFYGLGNFLFDAPWSNVPETWYYGYMVRVSFSEKLNFEIIPYKQCKEEPIVQLLPSNSFEERINELNEIILDDKKLEDEFTNFVMKKKFPLSPMLPYHNHYLRALYHRRWLPDLIPEQNKLEILNWARCESLHECQVRYLEEQLKKELT